MQRLFGTDGVRGLANQPPMTPEIVYCFEDQSAEEAERLMQEKQIRRLPVLTREKQLAGIIALGDLATKTDDVQQVGRTVREISEPAAST